MSSIKTSPTVCNNFYRKFASNLFPMYTNRVRETCGAVTITTDPCVVLVDEKFSVKVSGLGSRQKITVKSTIREDNCVFSGCGCYEAGTDGQVDVATQPSSAGTYTGIEDMGLIWSMIQSPGQRPGNRLVKSDVTTPQIVDIFVFNGHLSFDDIHSEEMVSIAETKVERWYKAHNVTRIPIREGKIRGTLFVPKGSQQLPGVIDMFGSAGGCIEFRASLLASRGFVVLALAIFSYEDLPKTLGNLSLDYLKEAAIFVSNHPKVQPGGIGVIGVSKGGEYCQLMGTHCPEVTAIVSINGLPAVFMYPIRNGDKMIETKRPDSKELLSRADYDNTEGVVFKTLFIRDSSDFFPLWDSGCRFLSICGGDDHFMDPESLQLQYDTFPDDKKYKMELITYPGAGHLIEPPYSPLARTTFFKYYNCITLNGGFPKQHADAQEDSWKRILQFFRKNLSINDFFTSKL